MATLVWLRASQLYKVLNQKDKIKDKEVDNVVL